MMGCHRWSLWLAPLMVVVAVLIVPTGAGANDLLDNILGNGGSDRKGGSSVGRILDSLGGSGRDTSAGSRSGTRGLSDFEIGRGLREALTVGTERVVGRLGVVDGFNLDPAVHIPLPRTLQRVQDALGAVGLSGMVDDLETRLNRAAEIATPRAKALFFDAIEAMTLDDVRKILSGPDDAATRYFEGKMTNPLARAMRPIVDDALQDAGAVRAYDNVMGEYEALPLVPNLKADLTDHVLKLGIAGIFHYLAIEEAAIRNNPVKRTTELLRHVFG